MGLLDRLLGRPSDEQFSETVSISDPVFAAWLTGSDPDSSELVTPYTVLGLSAVLRSVQVISTTIAGLPLRTYERQGDERVRIPSDFDDPWPGPDGMTPFAWVETVLIHLLLWREAFLWHEPRSDGGTVAYRPIIPSAIRVKRDAQGRKRFVYRDPGSAEEEEVGTETITHIAGPSLDGTCGHPFLYAARAVFSAALSGDRTAQRMLRRGIRIAGLVTPRDDEEDFDPIEGAAIKDQLRQSLVGVENAGDVAVINRKLSLSPWTMSNVDAQWDETRKFVLMEVEQLFGVPPHLLADTEKQTSWGTGVQEQNLGLARFTLRGWSDRLEQVLSRRLPAGPIEQFCEFDYKGLLQGTPAQEIDLLIQQVDAKLITTDEARKIMNLPPLTAAQKRELNPPAPAAPTVLPNPQSGVNAA